MRHKRDFYTPLLPFDESQSEEVNSSKNKTDDLAPSAKQEPLLMVLTKRLANYLLEIGLPKNFPLLKLLPSLNKTTNKDTAIRFTEDQAAELLKNLGAKVEPSPTYLGRSRYRVTISQDLANSILGNLENNELEK